MHKSIKLVAALLVATTITQLNGMSRFSQAFARARVAMASPITSMRVAASRWMPRIGVTAASPAHSMASKLWNNKGRVALGAAAVGVATQAPSKAKAESPTEFKPYICESRKGKELWTVDKPGVFTPIKTLSDLHNEANTDRFSSDEDIVDKEEWVGAPSSLKHALNKLTPEAARAIDRYHQGCILKVNPDIRAKLWRDVELEVRNEEERTEILDNLRWLQRDGRIGRVLHSSNTYPSASLVAPLFTLAPVGGWIAAGFSLGLISFNYKYQALNKKTKVRTDFADRFTTILKNKLGR